MAEPTDQVSTNSDTFEIWSRLPWELRNEVVLHAVFTIFYDNAITLDEKGRRWQNTWPVFSHEHLMWPMSFLHNVNPPEQMPDLDDSEWPKLEVKVDEQEPGQEAGDVPRLSMIEGEVAGTGGVGTPPSSDSTLASP